MRRSSVMICCCLWSYLSLRGGWRSTDTRDRARSSWFLWQPDWHICTHDYYYAAIDQKYVITLLEYHFFPLNLWLYGDGGPQILNSATSLYMQRIQEVNNSQLNFEKYSFLYIRLLKNFHSVNGHFNVYTFVALVTKFQMWHTLNLVRLLVHEIVTFKLSSRLLPVSRHSVIQLHRLFLIYSWL